MGSECSNPALGTLSWVQGNDPRRVHPAAGTAEFYPAPPCEGSEVQGCDRTRGDTCASPFCGTRGAVLQTNEALGRAGGVGRV